MHKRFIPLIIVVLAAVGIGIWWAITQPTAPAAGRAIFGSGFIETTTVTISPEISGRVVSIQVDEGAAVKSGDVLVKLDDSLFKAQLQQSEAAVKVAQSAYDQAVAAQRQVVIASEGAKSLWQNMLEIKNNPLELDAQIVQARNQLDLATLALQYQKDTSGTLRNPEVISWQLAFATQQSQAARNSLQSLVNIKNNPQTINSSLDQASSAYQTSLAVVEVASKAVIAASRQIEQTQAAVNLTQVQLAKTILTSPTAGTVTARNAEPGESVQPGSPLLTVSRLDEVTLTAYVSERYIGQVNLGREVQVTVDSFPGQTFAGQITYISPQAEFTPKNIRTLEDRQTTVFAVKIKLSNSDHRLKPGLPADVSLPLP